MIHYDKILSHIGEFGLYQKRLCIFLFILTISNSIHITSVVFNNFTPKFRCAVPGLLNDTYQIQNSSHGDLINLYMPYDTSIGQYSQCYVYTVGTNGTVTNNTRECSQWVYNQEGSFSLVMDFDLVCNRAIYKAHGNSMLLFGMLVGSLLGGALSDFFGRKKTIILGVMIQSVIAACFSLVKSITLILTFRFLLTLTGTAAFQAVFVLLAETVGVKKRSIASMGSMLGFSLGLFILALIHHFIGDWRTAQIVQSIPFLVYGLFWFLIPESPRWLITKQRWKEATDIITNIAKVNQTDIPIELNFIQKSPSCIATLNFKTSDETCTHNISAGSKMKLPETTIRKRMGWISIFSNRDVFLRISILCFSWVTITMVYYGLSLGVGDLIPGNLFVNFVLQSTMEMVGNIICTVILESAGRKKLFAANMIFSGFATFGLGVLDLTNLNDIRLLSISVFCIGKLCITIAFSLIFVITTELLPTKVRNSGLGFCSCVARIGGIISPYIVSASLLIPGRFGQAFPVLLFGVLSLSSGLSTILLPETRNRQLPEKFRKEKQDRS